MLFSRGTNWAHESGEVSSVSLLWSEARSLSDLTATERGASQPKTAAMRACSYPSNEMMVKVKLTMKEVTMIVMMMTGTHASQG